MSEWKNQGTGKSGSFRVIDVLPLEFLRHCRLTFLNQARVRLIVKVDFEYAPVNFGARTLGSYSEDGEGVGPLFETLAGNHQRDGSLCIFRYVRGAGGPGPKLLALGIG